MFMPTFNVEFNEQSGFITEVILCESDAYGDPVVQHTIPVYYEHDGYVDEDRLQSAVDKILDVQVGKGENEWYPATIYFVVVDDNGFATIYEDGFEAVIEDWVS